MSKLSFIMINSKKNPVSESSKFHCSSQEVYSNRSSQEVSSLQKLDVIEDVCDGNEYKRHKDFLSSPANISLMLNTDGVAIFRLSITSLWPAWLAVNESPKDER